MAMFSKSAGAALVASALVAGSFQGTALLLAQDSPRSQPEKSGTPDATRLFDQLDANGDGKIAADEVDESRRRFFDRLLRTGDANEDGVLTKAEFTKAAAPPRPVQRPGGGEGERGRRGPGGGGDFFARLDRDGDGKVTRDELPGALRERLAPLFERLGKDSLTKEDLQQARGGAGNREEMFKRLDTNGDGVLEASEIPERGRRMFDAMARRLGKDEGAKITREEFLKTGGPGGPGRPGGQPGRPDGARMARGPALFRLLDSDSDGKLSKEELAKAAEKFEELDSNSDGSLDPRELFGSGERGGRMAARPGNARAEEGRPGARRPGAEGGRTPDGLFQRFDTNKDGKITKEEAPERMRQNFDRIDADGDGAIVAEELQKAFSNRRPGGRRPQDGEKRGPGGRRRPAAPQE